jgi:hypothetical protein
MISNLQIPSIIGNQSGFSWRTSKSFAKNYAVIGRVLASRIHSECGMIIHHVFVPRKTRFWMSNWMQVHVRGCLQIMWVAETAGHPTIIGWQWPIRVPSVRRFGKNIPTIPLVMGRFDNSIFVDFVVDGFCNTFTNDISNYLIISFDDYNFCSSTSLGKQKNSE